MSVKADQLSRAGARGLNLLQENARDVLAAIDAKLQAHNTALGLNVVDFDLPDTIHIAGLSRAQAQSYLYSILVASLEARGFEVRFVLMPGRSAALPKLYIRWTAALDPAEASRLRETLRRVQIAPDKLVDFIAGADAPPAPP